ncbi:MAG: hypothetical protein ABSF90_14925 [Syntrophobacteraceae bacterium]|jgi:hypothetical protein
MGTPISRKFHDKKFMWDGLSYEDGEKAAQAADIFRKEGFEVEMLAEGDRHLIYTRRVSVVQPGKKS